MDGTKRLEQMMSFGSNGSRPDVSERNIQSGRNDWYVFDKATGARIQGPYSTKDQAKCECFDLARGSYRISRETK